MRTSLATIVMLVAGLSAFDVAAEDSKDVKFVSKDVKVVNVTATDLGQISLDAPTEKCIRENAAKVEQAIADLGEAADFLVGKLCAEQVAEENAVESKLQQANTARQWQKMCDEEKAAKKDKTAQTEQSGGRDATDYCALGRVGFLVEPSDGRYTLYSPGTEPAVAIALAAHLLLDIRLSHSSAAERH